ncbi:MAG: GDP-mannose 4,6-dehydratase [Methanomicrobiaceae archaeon]|nr:GDP-mannose 4,6-dehydratase [Methanomicrobiaceae archaeon]
MKVLITGSSGFSGRYLTGHIKNEAEKSQSKIEIAGLCRSDRQTSDDLVNQFKGDICDYSEISDAISEFKPDYTIHLAGGRTGSLKSLFQTNVLGTVNLLEAVREHCDKSSRFLYVSSSAVYGYAGDDPIFEETPLRPAGEYGITKAAGEMAAISYSIKYGMNVSVVRPFNLLGPGQDESFVTGRIISQVSDILKGERDSLSLHSTYSCRDFVDVRDAVSAYWSIISDPEFEKRCKGRIYNAGSGRSTSICLVISLLEKITNREIKINLPDIIKPEIIPCQVSDNKKIIDNFGWKPEYTLKKSLSDMLKYCENKGKY